MIFVLQTNSFNLPPIRINFFFKKNFKLSYRQGDWNDLLLIFKICWQVKVAWGEAIAPIGHRLGGISSRYIPFDST